MNQQALSVQPPQVALTTNEVLESYKAEAAIVFKSGLAPKKFANPEQIIVAGLYGRELGISFQRSLREIHVINGIPGISANLMLSLIRERMPQATVQVVTTTAKRCEIRAARKPTDELTSFSFSIEEANLAGLTGKDVWKSYPEDLLFARAVTRMGRRLFSDVLLGFVYTPEELEYKPEVSGIETAVAGPGRMPKRGSQPESPTQAPPPATVVEAEEIKEASTQTPTPVAVHPAVTAHANGQIPEAPPLILTAEEPDQVIDRKALNDLALALNGTTDTNAVERIYDGFRATHREQAATLMEAYEIYTFRVEKLKR